MAISNHIINRSPYPISVLSSKSSRSRQNSSGNNSLQDDSSNHIFLHSETESIFDEDDFHAGDLANSTTQQRHQNQWYSENGTIPRLKGLNKISEFPASHCISSSFFGETKPMKPQLNEPIKIRFYANELQNFHSISMDRPTYNINGTGNDNGSITNGGSNNTNYTNTMIDESNVKNNQSMLVKSQEKRKLTRRYFVTVFSICYAILLVVFGAVIFIGDVLITQYPLPQAFCIFMLLTAFSYFLFLYIDIRLHVSRTRNTFKAYNERQQAVERYLMEMDSTTAPPQMQTKFNLVSIKATISHKYCFRSGRHSRSLYLKLGAAWFALGLVTHSILQISYQVYFLLSNGGGLYQCASYIILTVDILFPIYSIFTLIFIVKYMDVVINAHRSLARICLMHAIGTSLAFWVCTIIRETADAIARSDAEEYERTRQSEPNQTFTFIYHDCGQSIAFSIHREFAEYLYPFIIEHCILVCGIWYEMYKNIHRCPDQTLCECKHSLNQENRFDVLPSVHSGWHSSIRGVLAGAIHLILAIVFIVLMFLGVQNEDYLETIVFTNTIFELCVMIVMIVATLLAYIQTSQFDVVTKKSNSTTLDDVLLFIGIPALVMEFLFSLAPAIYYRLTLRICATILRLIQVLIQTPFIVDGLRRCSNEAKVQQKKPGREFVAFLIIANVSLWMFHTFSVKSAYDGDERYEFYGFILWNILNHVTLPLIMFYRFHSSVCLVDIWNYAYEPDMHTS